MSKVGYYRVPQTDIEAPDDNDELLRSDRDWAGIKTERSCQDITFLLLYVLCILGMGACAVIAFTRGDPSLIEFVKSEGQSRFTESIVQLHESRYVLASSAAMSVVLALVWVQLLKIFTRLFVILTLIVGVCAAIAAGVVLITYGTRSDSIFMKVTGGFTIVIAAGIVIGALVMRKQLSIAITFMKEACRGLQNNLTLLAIVIVLLGIFAAFIVGWAMSLAYLFTIADDTAEFGGFEIGIRYVTLLMVFGLFWTISLLSAIFRTTVAGCVASWYFSRNPYAKQESGNAALNSFRRAATKSFGSLAFGSLIVSFLELMYFIASLAERQAKNRVIRWIVRAVRCILGCFVSLANSFNRYAYVYVAMYGDSFCVSGKRVKALMGRNALSGVVSDRLAVFVLIVGQIAGIAASCMLTVLTFAQFEIEVTPAPLIVAAVSAGAIFSIVSMLLLSAVNTVFVCYLEDLERNRESQSYYATCELHDHMQSLKN